MTNNQLLHKTMTQLLRALVATVKDENLSNATKTKRVRVLVKRLKQGLGMLEAKHDV